MGEGASYFSGIHYSYKKTPTLFPIRFFLRPHFCVYHSQSPLMHQQHVSLIHPNTFHGLWPYPFSRAWMVNLVVGNGDFVNVKMYYEVAPSALVSIRTDGPCPIATHAQLIWIWMVRQGGLKIALPRAPLHLNLDRC